MRNCNLLVLWVVIFSASCKVSSEGYSNLNAYKDCVFEITYNGSEDNIMSILKSVHYNDKVMDVEQVVKNPGFFSLSSMKLVCRGVDADGEMQIRKELQKCQGVLSVVVEN